MRAGSLLIGLWVVLLLLVTGLGRDHLSFRLTDSVQMLQGTVLRGTALGGKYVVTGG